MFEKLFGIPGSPLAHLLSEVQRQTNKKERGIEFVLCRHETGAVYVAHGYSIVTGGLGVALVSAGPGATNALTGALNAQANGDPVLVITGEVDQKFFGRGYLQEGVETGPNIDEMFHSAVQYSAVISNQANFPTLLQRALREMLSFPRRAAHLSLPANVSAECVCVRPPDDRGNNPVPVPKRPSVYRAEPSGSDPKQVMTALRCLVQAKRPLIFLGNGCRRALRDAKRLARFIAFVEKFQIPVTTTPHAKGIFPESHPLSLRNYGMTGCLWPERYMGLPQLCSHFDALLVLGSTLGQLATSAIESDPYSNILIPNGPFIQVDLDTSVIGRNFPVTLGIVAELGATIDILCRRGRRARLQASDVEERRAFIQCIKTSDDSGFAEPRWRNSNDAPANPAALMSTIGEVLNCKSAAAGAGHIFIDAGNCAGWSLHNMVIDPPLQFHIAIDLAPMGFAVGAVVGGKMGARVGIPCVAVVGDGAFLMHGAEVSTAAANRVGAIWIVLYDDDLSMTSQGMAQCVDGWRGRFELGNPDLIRVAEGLGARAVSVMPHEGPLVFRDRLLGALRRAEENKPQVIVVHIDRRLAPPHHWRKLEPPVCGPRPDNTSDGGGDHA
ncbi:MAG: thiamine pyrophosphate-binding protein [Acetobacteraceae bacterium]|nr:thiamine pyrophosphate-binding protein [Acetobacteraceae bacterium]